MIYCAWLAPMNYINAETPLTDCQILLYIMTERYPSAKKYRDVFERIKTAVLSLISQGKHEPRNPVNLDSNVQAGFESLTAAVGPTMGADFSFMINTMTGNTMAANANALTAVPASTAIFDTVAGRVALSGCSIFIASMTASVSPVSTTAPGSTSTDTMVPCIGAVSAEALSVRLEPRRRSRPSRVASTSRRSSRCATSTARSGRCSATR